MIEIGTTIVYGTQICKITDKKNQTFGKISREYYVLTPVFDSKNTIYVPVDNENLVAKMKKILSAEEIYTLIDSIPSSENVWIEDDKERSHKYKEIIENGDRLEIIKVIKTLYEHKQDIEQKNRKLRSSDETILNRAEKVLYEEFALVLDIQKEEVVPFIARKIEIKEKRQSCRKIL